MRAIAGMARSYMRGSAFHGMIVGASLLANPLDADVAWKLRSRASSLLHVQPDTVHWQQKTGAADNAGALGALHRRKSGAPL